MTEGAEALKAGERAPPLAGFTKAEAPRMPAFYLIVAGMFSLSMLVTSLHVEYTGILKAHELDLQTAASMFMISGVTAAVLMPVVGRLLDTLPTKRMFFGGLWLQSAALLAITLVQDWEGAVVFVRIFGLNTAVTMTYAGYLWPRYFERKYLGSIQGTGQMIVIFGASIGPVPLGWALDTWGGYDTMQRLLALIPVGISVLVALLMPQPRPPGSAADA